MKIQNYIEGIKQTMSNKSSVTGKSKAQILHFAMGLFSEYHELNKVFNDFNFVSNAKKVDWDADNLERIKSQAKKNLKEEIGDIIWYVFNLGYQLKLEMVDEGGAEVREAYESFINGCIKFVVNIDILKNNKSIAHNETMLENNKIDYLKYASFIQDRVKKYIFYKNPIGKIIFSELRGCFYSLAKIHCYYNKEETMYDVMESNVNKLKRRFPSGFSEVNAINKLDKVD